MAHLDTHGSLAQLAMQIHPPPSLANGRRANGLCFPCLKNARTGKAELRNLTFDLEGMRLLSLADDNVHKAHAFNTVVGYQPFSHNSVVVKFSGIQRDYHITVLYAADMSLLLDALSLCVTWIHARTVEEASSAWNSVSTMAYRDVLHMGWLLFLPLSAQDPRGSNYGRGQTKVWCVVLPGRIVVFRSDRDSLARTAVPLVWIDDPSQLVVRISATGLIVRACGGPASTFSSPQSRAPTPTLWLRRRTCGNAASHPR